MQKQANMQGELQLFLALMVTAPQEQEPNYQEPTEEDIRRALVQKINVGATREELEMAHSKVWDTTQLSFIIQQTRYILLSAASIQLQDVVGGRWDALHVDHNVLLPRYINDELKRWYMWNHLMTIHNGPYTKEQLERKTSCSK